MLEARVGSPVMIMTTASRLVSSAACSNSIPGTCDIKRSTSTMSNACRASRSSASRPRPQAVTA